MDQIIKYMPEEKGDTLNEGRSFTFYEVGDGGILLYDVLVEIFQYLSFADLRQCLLVSKEWRIASLCPVLWKKVELHELNLDVRYLERLVNCGVQQLHMESSKIGVNIQPLATPYFKSSTFKILQYLRMDYLMIENDLLEHIVLMVPYLKWFIFNSRYPRQIFSKNVFRALLHLQFLEKLHLFRINLYFPEIMNMLDKIDNVMNLQSLGLLCTLEDCDTSENATNFVEKYLSIFPNLQCVEINSISGFFFNDKIFKLVAQLEHLKCLKIGTTKVNSEVMETLTQKENFDDLKELAINCERMEEESLILLLRASLNVEVLDLHSICLTTAILKALLSLKHLKQLGMRIEDAQLPAIFLHNDTLQEFDNKLPSLYLRNDCSHPINLSKMLSRFKYLNYLRFEYFYFDEETIIKILKMRTLKILELFFYRSYYRLDISTLNQIQVEVYELEELRIRFLNFPIEYILSRAPYLKLLEVCFYPLNKEFLSGVSSLKRLEELKCTLFCDQEGKCSNFSELDANLQLDNLIKVYVYWDESLSYGLENLLSMCRKVKNLSVHKFHVTEKLIDIIKAMKELEYLEMTDVTMFRDNCVAEILEHCPKLTEHRVEIKILKK